MFDRSSALATLLAAADALGVEMSEAQAAALIDYLSLMSRWNATYNLTAVRDPARMVTQHLVDCMAAVPAIQRLLASQHDASDPRSATDSHSSTGRPQILDVGSGGGLPGIVLAVLMPNAQLTCVDSVGKKIAFLNQVVGELRLNNLHPIRSRVEALRPLGFDLIISRAFASLADFVSLTRGRLNRLGSWVAMKGKVPDEELIELSRLSNAPQVFHVEQLRVPGLEADRCLVCMR